MCPRRFLGWRFVEIDAKKLWLSQKGYVEKVLDRFNMNNVKPISTPLANHFKLSTVQCPKIDSVKYDMSKVPYASVMGCLMYAIVCTRLDLAQGVSVVSKFLTNLGKQYWDAVKWIFIYLRGTTNYGIMFER